VHRQARAGELGDEVDAYVGVFILGAGAATRSVSGRNVMPSSSTGTARISWKTAASCLSALSPDPRRSRSPGAR